MEYFKVLNLSREPFSNSPDPEFFYQAPQYVACLQKLELSIRLRRGLNVIIGDIGSGKTTLCRQLIRKCAGDQNLEPHLVLDPYFTSPLEFLTALARTFGLLSLHDPLPSSEWEIKDKIQKYLFQRGMDDDKIVVLLMDEGQKIPDFCLEILRELLNYEVNEFKLLQIVIFAQKEFEQILPKYPNLSDRINFYHVLGPLTFKETRDMIRYRLNCAKESYRNPALFTLPGLWAVYRHTGGYPRKIIHLCHRVLLTLIIRGKSRAGWSIVHWCARMSAPAPSRRWNWWLTATALMGVVTLVTIVGLVPESLKAPVVRKAEELKAFMTKKEQPLRSSSPGVLKVPITQKGEGARSVSDQEKPSPQPAEREKDPGPDTSPGPSAAVAGTGLSPERNEAGGASSTVGPPRSLDAVPAAGGPGPAESMATSGAAGLKAVTPVGAASSHTALSDPGKPDQGKENDNRTSIVSAAMAPPPPVIRTEALAAGSQSEQAAGSEAQPASLPVMGQIALRRGESLGLIIRRVYGVYDRLHVRTVAQANPSIKNLDSVGAGKTIDFPAVPQKPSPFPARGWWVQVARKDRLDDAYDILRAYPADSPPVRLFPHWTSRESFKFSILVRDCCSSEVAAREVMSWLPPALAAEAKIIRKWDDDTIFFAR